MDKRMEYGVFVKCRRYLLIIISLLQAPLFASVEPALFYQNLREPTPQWMTEQIERDLSPFQGRLSRMHLDSFYAKYCEYNHLIRVRIVKGEIFVEKSSHASPSLAEFILQAVFKMHYLAPLPDLDFIFTTHDVMSYLVAMQAKMDPDNLIWPVFTISKDKLCANVILMPDWYALDGFGPDKAAVLEGRRVSLWEHKKRIAFFRGADSGAGHRPGWRETPRCRLVALSLQYPDLIDAKFTCLLPYEKDSSIRDVMLSEGMVGDYVPIQNFSRYRYLMDVDGHSANTPRVALCLYSGSVLFKHASNEVLWFFTRLKPYEHFIPVAADFSDLVTQIEWAKNHDEECRQIADNAYQLAEEVLREECVYLYFYRLLEAYAKKQSEWHYD